MKKKSFHMFRNNYYLLGEDREGIKYYLEEPDFDCGWYWGGLYIETFTNNRQPTRSRDISSHSHFDYMFLKNPDVNLHLFFKGCVLNPKERQELITKAQKFYELRERADSIHCKKELVDEYTDLVMRQLPEVIADIVNMLGDCKTAQDFTNKVKLY